ncbi:uncharacterized protein LOC126708275 [Quercus robur]|uniref:uncharacterized protein LOC126708275 n=1 Tax=Quercus robur TaxID=38942 RepID=UPI0021615AEF|nr:uncharacterized protein LOC126708275 [Quercus robur]
MAHFLSREEENELVRSDKKVKESHGGHEDPITFRLGNANLSTPVKLSFKNKLVGEIPGAYTQAFDFATHMDTESVSDEEIDEVRKGFVAIKLSKETKSRIRAPWSKAIIIKEDLETVLKRGHWFIGEHFLSIRKWEANFKPSEALVTSMAVWVRLNELPIEYYDAGVLREIGQALGNVLRIDTHTNTEAKGRFTRIYVQVDIGKPLVTSVGIGKHQQKYSIRPPSPPANPKNTARVFDKEAQASPPPEVHEVESHDATFEPWMVVSRRRKGPKVGQQSNTNLKPELHHSFKNVSTVELLETNKGDKLPAGAKSVDGKRKARSDVDLSVETELNPMGNKLSGLVGSGPLRITQTKFPSGPSIKFNQGLTLSKPVATSVKGKRDLA